MKLFIVTTIGVGTDTEAKPFRTHEDAHKYMYDVIDRMLMRDFEGMCKDCIKGFSNVAQCDIEIQIHETELPR